MKQFQIWYANLPLKENSHVQGGPRPVIVISDETTNRNCPVITIIPLTSKTKKRAYSTHVTLRAAGLRTASTALCDQITTVDKRLLDRCIGEIRSPRDRAALGRALAVQFGMAAQAIVPEAA